MKDHALYPLTILNYTPKTQYDKKWCRELIHACGLVVGSSGEIYARPLPKFFNHYEISGELPTEDFELYDKMDGSLAIMFHYKNNRIFCTRGSFTSDQARKAEEIFEKKYKDIEVRKDCTYCFEVIYPENRIVVNYENIEDLFLISITHTRMGEEVDIYSCGFKTVNRMLEDKSIEDLVKTNLPNKEGYVLKFSNGIRMKIKFSMYMAQHKGKKTVSHDSIK